MINAIRYRIIHVIATAKNIGITPHTKLEIAPRYAHSTQQMNM